MRNKLLKIFMYLLALPILAIVTVLLVPLAVWLWIATKTDVTEELPFPVSYSAFVMFVFITVTLWWPYLGSLFGLTIF